MKIHTQIRTPDQIVCLLKIFQPFQNLDDAALTLISEVTSIVEYLKDELIYDFGKPAEKIYCVLSGEVKHVFCSDDESNSVINVLKKGDVFGWASIFRLEPFSKVNRIAKAVCLDDAEIAVINCRDMKKIARHDPQAFDSVMRSFTNAIGKRFGPQENPLNNNDPWYAGL